MVDEDLADIAETEKKKMKSWNIKYSYEKQERYGEVGFYLHSFAGLW